MITDWVGGVKKGQNLDYVIFEWSLSRLSNILPDGFEGQFSSSDPSKQSSSESHLQVFKTHFLFLHWNSLGSQLPAQPDPPSSPEK